MFGAEELEAVTRVMKSGNLSGYQGNWSDNFYGGEEIKALEKEWSEYFGVKHAIACNSATSGLWMACNAIGIGFQADGNGKVFDGGIERDEIIVTPYSMTCSASIPLLFGANPVFSDIEPNYFCLDADSIESKITDRTKAIIVVDIFGQPYDADRINAIAKKHNLIVIEDAAQAIGAKYKGKYAGTLGDIGVYSLNRHKHISCGEGGIVVTDNDELAFKLRLSLNHSEAVINDKEHKNLYYNDNLIPIVGMNLRMTELSAAVAREQLKKLDSILEIYRDDAKYFPVKVRPDCEHSFYRYAFIGDQTPVEWEDIGVPEFIFKQGYIIPLYKMPLFRNLGYNQKQCPVCEDVEKNITLEWRKVPV